MNNNFDNLNLFQSINESLFLKEELKENLLSSIDGHRVIDLLFHFPRYYKVLVSCDNFSNLKEDDTIKCVVKITDIQVIRNGKFGKTRYIFKSKVTSNNEDLDIIFFKIHDNLKQKLQKGTLLIVTGKLENYKGKKCIIHPRVSFKIESSFDSVYLVKVLFFRDSNFNFEELESSNIVSIESFYKVKENLNQFIFKSLIKSLIDFIKNSNIFNYNTLNSDEYLPSFIESLENIHFSKDINDLKADSLYFKKLAFCEMLASNLSINLIRNNSQELKGMIIKTEEVLIKKALDLIGFELTDDQKIALEEILNDQKNPLKMSRLIQGDVGCGKTVLALLASLNTIEAGYCVMFLSPTSILASQHYEYFREICNNLDIGVGIITGSTTKKEKDKIKSMIRMGFIKILIGTHALLFIEDLNFENIGLFIIDEQHQFGVEQRYRFMNKNIKSDVLMMTATPIPRTLLLSIYGDISVSVIKQKPKNRKTIDTRMIPLKRYEEVKKSILNLIKEGGRIYWVCKLVEKEEVDEEIANINVFSKFKDVVDVKTRLSDLKKTLPNFEIDYVYGGIKSSEKDSIMNRFKEGKTKLLVSTTVIEVGVNVPEANLIIIENAEMFGLAQLHQLRGRVGRGDKQSYCILLHRDNLSENGKKRLEVLKNNTDGFLIAEADLQMRGGGDLIGEKQSGFNVFKVFSFYLDKDILNLVNLKSKKLRDDMKIDEISKNEVDLFLNLFLRDVSKVNINII